jgi:hypothetical protein
MWPHRDRLDRQILPRVGQLRIRELSIARSQHPAVSPVHDPASGLASTSRASYSRSAKSSFRGPLGSGRCHGGDDVGVAVPEAAELGDDYPAAPRVDKLVRPRVTAPSYGGCPPPHGARISQWVRGLPGCRRRPWVRSLVLLTTATTEPRMNLYDPADLICYVHLSGRKDIRGAGADGVSPCMPLPSGYANQSPPTRLRRTGRPTSGRTGGPGLTA